MVNIEDEKRLISNLTVDYDKFIRHGSVDEIKRLSDI